MDAAILLQIQDFIVRLLLWFADYGTINSILNDPKSNMMESEWAPDKIKASQFTYKGPLQIPFKQPLILVSFFSTTWSLLKDEVYVLMKFSSKTNSSETYQK